MRLRRRAKSDIEEGADPCDPTLPDRVRDLLPEGARRLVVEDSCVDVEEMRPADSWHMSSHPVGFLQRIR
jgi:hypothetical protein